MKWLTTLLLIFLNYISAHSQDTRGLSVPKTADKEEQKGATYALIVGVSKYRNPAIPQLQYADKDASAFCNYLIASGVDSNNIVLLLNENAKYSEIMYSLSDLTDKAVKGDKIFIYFSGHGDVESKVITNDGYLLPYDAPKAVYAISAININILQSYISTLSAHGVQAIVITDACHSGNLAGGLEGLKNISNVLKNQWQDEVKILSCQPGELSLEGKQWGEGRGLFSYELINGMAGAADKNNDGIVTLQELNRFMTNTVADEANPNSQNPILAGDMATIVSKTNADYLKKYRSKGNQMIAAVDVKGFDEAILKKLPDSIQHFYSDFNKLLETGGELLYEEGFTVEGLKKIPDSIKHYYQDGLKRNNTIIDFIAVLDTNTGDPLNVRKITAYDYLLKIPDNNENKTLLGIMKRKYAVKRINEINDYAGQMLETNYIVAYQSFSKGLEIYDLETLINILGKEKLQQLNVLSKIYFTKAKLLQFDTTKKILPLIDSAIQSDTLASYAYQSKAIEYSKKIKQYDSAIKYARIALRLSPRLSYCYTIIGSSYRFLYQFDSSLKYFIKSKEVVDQINKDTAYHAFARQYNYFANGKIFEDETKRFFKEMYSYPVAQIYTTFMMQQKPDSAEKYYKTYLYSDTLHTDIATSKTVFYDFVSRAYIEMGNTKKGIEYALKKEEITKDVYTEHDLASNYLLTGDVVNSLKYLEEAIKNGWCSGSYAAAMRDPNFEKMHSTPEFKALMKKYFPDQYKE